MKLELTARKPESPEVESFVFKPQGSLAWKAGQYLHYVLHHEPTDDRGSDRWFSIASAPFEKNVMLTTRFTRDKGSTFKKTLAALKPGDTVEFTDVDGDFIVDDPKQEYVFIAGGIGITPFRSILKEADHQGTPLRVKLLYGNRDRNVVFKEEFETLAKRNPHLSIHYLFSPERIDKTSLEKRVPDFKKPFFYVSGPEPMVESLGKLLSEMGVPKEHIKQDWFPGYPEE